MADPGGDCVLIVEDNPHSAELTAAFVRETGAYVLTAATCDDALARLEQFGRAIAFVITDIKLRGQSGLDLFRRIRATRPDLPIVLMTAYGSTDEAVAAMKDGAFYYFTKPIDFSLLLRIVREALEKRALAAQVADLHARLADGAARGRILGSSRALAIAIEHATAVAALETTVLLSGETGTGKELFAEHIHANSTRRARPMVTINCAALPEPLLESELFGHERGAFTGAVARKPGRFEAAHGGTVFLDEIGDLALPLQAKLLRVLESRTVEPLGASRSLTVDVRILAASNHDLATLVADGRFRQDLYYRLAAFPILLPPLRERRDDIPVLAAHFLNRFAREQRKPIDGVEPAALDALQAYAWPGNVRELRHAIERAVILAKGSTIALEHLPRSIADARAAAAAAETPGTLTASRLRELERQAVVDALREAGGNRTRAARALGLTRNQMRYRLRKMDPGDRQA